MSKIGIIDYSTGSLRGLMNALGYLGIDALASSGEDELELCDALILPGSGAFSDAMEVLDERGLSFFLRRQAAAKPILGVGLGMQLLFNEGHEIIECEGLGLLEGAVRLIDTMYPTPHMGWNALEVRRRSELLKGLDDEGLSAYFSHSYRATELDEDDLVAATDYGVLIPAIVERENVYGVQFRPEKSGEFGLAILRNFAELV